jgi:hypothetical protein
MNGPEKTWLESQLGKGETAGTLTATPLDPKVYGPGVVGVVMSLPITYQGVIVTTQISSVNAVRGRLGQSITYYSYGLPFPASLAKPGLQSSRPPLTHRVTDALIGSGGQGAGIGLWAHLTVPAEMLRPRLVP